MNKAMERLYNGIVKENPTFVLMLGMCPTLAVTTSAQNGLGMGLTTMVVLALSNLMISALRKVIPRKVRIPAFIVIIASFVTMAQLLLEAYLNSLNKALGVYIPLIVVNCIILGRAESYAYSHPPIPALFDGIGMGLGFTVALTCIGAVRELLGAGELFGHALMPQSYTPISIFILAPGAFFVLAMLTALQNFVKIQGEKKGKDMSKIQSGCNADCKNCTDSACSKRLVDDGGKEDAKGPKAGKPTSNRVALAGKEAQEAPGTPGVKEEAKASKAGKPTSNRAALTGKEAQEAPVASGGKKDEKPESASKEEDSDWGIEIPDLQVIDLNKDERFKK